MEQMVVVGIDAGNERKLVDRLLGMEDPGGRRFYYEFGHGVPPVAYLPTDAIADCSVQKDGGAADDDDDYDVEDDEVGISGC